MNPFCHLVGLLGRVINPIYTGQHNTERRRHTSKPRVGIKPMIPVFERPCTARPVRLAPFGTYSRKWNMRTDGQIGGGGGITPLFYALLARANTNWHDDLQEFQAGAHRFSHYFLVNTSVSAPLTHSWVSLEIRETKWSMSLTLIAEEYALESLFIDDCIQNKNIMYILSVACSYVACEIAEVCG
jgi:hypothetical protein